MKVSSGAAGPPSLRRSSDFTSFLFSGFLETINCNCVGSGLFCMKKLARKLLCGLDNLNSGITWVVVGLKPYRGSSTPSYFKFKQAPYIL